MTDLTSEWTSNVAMLVDGIMRVQGENTPIQSGILLYHSLVKSHRVTLIIDSKEKEKTQYWLRINGLIDHAAEVYFEPTDPEDSPSRRDIQIKRMKQDGPVSFIVESDTEVAEKMLEIGVPTLLYVHPLYMRPEHRPGYKEEVASWDSLVSAVKSDREKRANDSRLEEIR